MPLFAHPIPGVRPFRGQRHKAALSKFSSMLDLPVSLRITGLALQRFAFLLRLQVQGPPSLADPLSGRKVRWTFLLVRFAHGKPA